MRQRPERASPLVDNLMERLGRPNAPDNHLVLPRRQPFVSLVAELIERHTERSSPLLAHVVVQLRLHGWGRDFENLDARAGVGELLAEAQGKAVQSGFGGGVGGQAEGWDDGEVGACTGWC